MSICYFLIGWNKTLLWGHQSQHWWCSCHGTATNHLPETGNQHCIIYSCIKKRSSFVLLLGFHVSLAQRKWQGFSVSQANQQWQNIKITVTGSKFTKCDHLVSVWNSVLQSRLLSKWGVFLFFILLVIHPKSSFLFINLIDNKSCQHPLFKVHLCLLYVFFFLFW